MPIPFSLNDITASLGRYTTAKGNDYVDHVTNIEWEGNDIVRGSVQGSKRLPYTTRAILLPRTGSLVIEGYCTCPVGFNCKHVAALLTASYFAAGRQPDKGIRSEVHAWIEKFRGMASATETATTPRTAAANKTHGIVYRTEL